MMRASASPTSTRSIHSGHVLVPTCTTWGRNPVGVLIISPLFVKRTSNYFGFVGLSLFILAPVERHLGSMRWLVGLMIGHIGTTLIVARGLTINQRRGGVDRSHVEDVGTRLRCSIPCRSQHLSANGLATRGLRRCPDGYPDARRRTRRQLQRLGSYLSVVLGLATGPFLVKEKQRPAFER